MVSLEMILEEVSSYFELSIEQMKSKKRTAPMPIARGMFLYLAKEYFPDIIDGDLTALINLNRTMATTWRDNISGYMDSNDRVVIEAYKAIKKRLGSKEILEIPLRELSDGDLMTVKRVLTKPDWDKRNKEAIETINYEVDRRLMLNNK